MGIFLMLSWNVNLFENKFVVVISVLCVQGGIS